MRAHQGVEPVSVRTVALARYDQAIHAFATAARADLEIKTPYALVRVGQE
ncbi:hypothetical protein MOQ72_25725 [Saccharopolyspora sp. K220]|nr:hypothetical protein [Saccharopolyspora soli]MCI2420854.1 hypothetical protein [Saccharopolyspora soli]